MFFLVYKQFREGIIWSFDYKKILSNKNSNSSFCMVTLFNKIYVSCACYLYNIVLFCLCHLCATLIKDMN